MTEPFHVRRGIAADSDQCWDISWQAISDLAARHGTPWTGTAAEHWPRFQSLFDHLAEAAAEWWVAEDGDGRIMGHARSVNRGTNGDMFELTEFFVRPDAQSGGIGRALLERAFASDRGEIRVIIATTDVRAVACYYRSGTHVRFPIIGLSREPRANAADGIRLDAEPITTLTVDDVLAIDRDVLEHARSEAELEWLLADREGYVYRRDGRIDGFGFVSAGRTGPIAALDADTIPDILRHIESRAADLGGTEVGFEVPTLNEAAMTHLLGGGFRMDPFHTFLMSNRPFGRFDRYIGFAPPFVL